MPTPVPTQQLALEMNVYAPLATLAKRTEELLREAYKAIVAVEQFKPEVEQLIESAITQSDAEDDTYVFVTDEAREALNEFAKALRDLTSDYAEVQLHRAWRSAYELSGHLDDAISNVYQELVDAEQAGGGSDANDG